MTEYNATTACRDLRCTVVEYAYDATENDGEAPQCPACELREERWSVVATRNAAVKRAEAAEEERDRNKRAAVTLGQIVERQCRDVLDATGMHHLINEDGDGDWALVWERLAEMGAEQP